MSDHIQHRETANTTPHVYLRLNSYPVPGYVHGGQAVHMSTGCVVGQVDSQHHRQHQEPEEAEEQHPGPGHPNPVTAGERAAAIALLQRLVPSTGPGHDWRYSVRVLELS